MTKVVVLGLDGFDPLLSKKFALQGVMPSFKTLLKKSFYSKMKSTIPPTTIPVSYTHLTLPTN